MQYWRDAVRASVVSECDVELMGNLPTGGGVAEAWWRAKPGSEPRWPVLIAHILGFCSPITSIDHPLNCHFVSAPA